MATQEIKSTKWETFCQRFLDLHRGTLMTVMQINPSGRQVEVVRDMPLTDVSMRSNGCTDSIFLRFEQAGKREITHEIIDPIHVKLREEGEGRKGLQIDAENGSTLVLFRSGKWNELLEGLD
jgi:hypothetical protein